MTFNIWQKKCRRCETSFDVRHCPNCGYDSENEDRINKKRESDGRGN